MAQTPDPTPLEEAEVRSFVSRVYRELFDAHAPLDVFLASLDDDELEMRFPEEPVRGHVGFGRWYERIVNTCRRDPHDPRAGGREPWGPSHRPGGGELAGAHLGAAGSEERVVWP